MSVASDPKRTRRRRPGRALLLGLAGLVASCTLTRPSIDDCHKNSECQAAFGYGMVCVSGGRCERAAPNPRCTVALPADLLAQPGRYKGWHIYGSLMDRSSGTQLGRENAIRLALTEVDQEGGLDDGSMGFVFCNIEQSSKYDALDRTGAAVESARYLADQIGVPAIVGPSSSPDTLAVYKAVKDFGTLVISPAATSPALTGVDTPSATDDAPGLLWRTAPPDSVQGAAIAKYLIGKGVKQVAMVQEAGAYGEGLAAVFLPAFQSGGGSVQAYSFSSPGQRDAAIVSAGTDPATEVLFIASQSSDIAAFVEQANQSSDYDSKQLFLTDSAANSDLLTQAASAKAIFARIHGSRVEIPSGTVYQVFSASYNSTFGQDPAQLSYVAHTYDAAWLVFYGSAWSRFQEGGKVSGLGIARGLRHVSAGEPVPIIPSDWSKIVSSFKARESVDVAGASSSLDFDPVTEEIESVPIDIWTIAPTNDAFDVETTIQP